MQKHLHTLHLFQSYLNATENWAFNLVGQLPDAKVVIASKRFLPCNFYPSKFEYIIPPLRVIDNPDGILWLKFLNRMISKLLSLYPSYLKRRMDGKCDIVHSHFATVGWEYRKLAKRLNVPHVISFYGFDYESVPFADPEWERRYQILFQLADLFLCEGTHGAGLLHRMGCPERKIRVARLGVDVTNIPFWRRIKREGELNLLQIATFTEKKGHKYSIQAFLKALCNCPNMTLTFVGNDREGIKSDLQRSIIGTPAEGKIIFRQAIDFHSLHEFMKDYHAFIHPSCYTARRDCEGGAPVVLLDAQATGMPVISTRHCDIPEEVVHGKTGLLSEEKDADSLANSIKVFYMMNQGAYDSYTESSRNHVRTFFDVRKNALSLREAYIELKNNFVRAHQE